jgi:hypothetical protein
MSIPVERRVGVGLDPGCLIVFDRRTRTLQIRAPRNGDPPGTYEPLNWPGGDNKRSASCLQSDGDALDFAMVIAETHGCCVVKAQAMSNPDELIFELRPLPTEDAAGSE